MRFTRDVLRLLIPPVVLLVAGCGLFDGAATKKKLIQIAIWEDQATLHGGDLLTYLTDGNVEVRRRAAIAIGRIGDTTAYLSLAAVLADQDTIVRAHAALSLGFLRHKPAKAEVYKRIKTEENGFVLQYLIWAMGRLYAQDYGDSLIELLAHPDPRVRSRTALVMKILSHRPAGDAVAELLDDPDPEVRRNALRSIDRLNPENHLEAIRPLLADPDDQIRCLAAMAIGAAKDTASRKRLLAMLEDPNRWVRIFGIFGLGSLRDTLFVDAIGPYLLTEKDPGVLAQLVDGIGWHWQSEAVSYLEQLSNHPDVGVRVKLIAALTRSLHGDALGAVKPFADDPAWPVRAAIPKQLEFIGRAKREDFAAAVELINQLARDSVAAVRASAVNAGMAFGNAIYEAVAAGVHDKEDLVKYYAYNIFPFAGGRVPYDTLLQWYKNHLDDSRPDIRMALLALTANLSPSVQLGEIQREIFSLGMADPKREVRQYAAAVWLKFREDHRDEIGVFDSPINEETYDEYYRDYSAPPQVRFTTPGGDFVVELYSGETPRSVHHFLSLVQDGFYDHTPVGLVDNSRMIYLGDQRADGWGLGDQTVRDEVTLRRTERGSLVWLVGQRHDARSVFGICLAAQPLNDFSRTIFGKVISGMEVVERLRPLDTIDRAELITAEIARQGEQ